MEENGTIHHSFCITLSRLQAWASAVIAVGTIIGMLVAVVMWSENSIANVAAEVFKTELQGYHETMRPQLWERVDEAIDSKIAAHKIAAEQPFEIRLDGIEGRLTVLESTTSTELAATRRDINRVEAKIDRLLER